MESQGVDPGDLSSSADVNDNVNVHDMGSSVPPQEHYMPIQQQNLGAFHMSPIPNQHPLPSIFNSAQEASRALMAANAHPLRPVSYSYSNFPSPSPSRHPSVPDQHSPLAKPLIQSHDSFKPLFNVAPKDRRGKDVMVGMDPISKYSYMSRCVASEIGLEVWPYVFSPEYTTSKGIFTPEAFAVNVNMWSHHLGITDDNHLWKLAITPDIMGRVEVTLGTAAIAKLRGKSIIFNRKFEEAPRPDHHQQARRFRRSNRSSVTSSSRRAPNSLAARLGTPSQSTPNSRLGQHTFASSSANMSSYTPPTPFTLNRPPPAVPGSVASGRRMRDHLQCPPGHSSLPNSLASENSLQVVNYPQLVREGAEMVNVQDTSTPFYYDTPFQSNPESHYDQHDLVHPEQKTGSPP